MDFTKRQSEIITSGERETYPGAVFFGHLTGALLLYNEVHSLVAQHGDFLAERNQRVSGIHGRPPPEEVMSALLSQRWKLMDMLYKDIIDNYQTYLEQIVKSSLREAGAKAPPRFQLRDSFEKLREQFGIEPDQWEGRERRILNICAKRDILTHNRARIDPRYLDKAGTVSSIAKVGDEIVINESNILEAGQILSDSVRHIEHELIDRLPNLDLRVSGPRYL